MNREAWLTEAAKVLATWLIPKPDMRKVRVSCSFPSHGALAKRRTVGQAWCPTATVEGVMQIFISPVLSDRVSVLETLLHELVHAACGVKCGHRGEFIRTAKAVGFERPWTQTPATAALKKRIMTLAKKLGPYPHEDFKPGGGGKKQTTRLLKVGCVDCGCVIRITRTWLDSIGAPTCGCGGTMEEL